MDEKDLADWQLCWKANLLFYTSITKPQTCIKCFTVQDATGIRRSSFWLDATRCSAGHRQATKLETQNSSLGVCASCDQMYMFDVVRGKHMCRREGCRRVIGIHNAEMRVRLISNMSLWDNFLALLERHRVYECIIHCDDVEYENTRQAFKAPTQECNHDRNVCNACLKAAFESAIKGGRIHDLVCPDPECKKPIPLDVLRSNISTDVFKIYNKQLALKTMSKDEHFRWCSCGHGQVNHLEADNPEWVCLSCKKRHCYICKDSSLAPCSHLAAIDARIQLAKRNEKDSASQVLSAHAANVAATQKRLLENEVGTKREIARTTKKCPKAGCCNKIERNDGCGHFTCQMCRTEFCWCCKVIWKAGVVLHLIGCKIGTKRQISVGQLDKTGYGVGWDKDDGYDLTLDDGLWLIPGHM